MPHCLQTVSIKSTFHCHTGRINSVTEITTDQNEGGRELVSASSDHTAVVWRCDQSGHLKVVAQLRGHAASVNVARGATVLLQNRITKSVVVTSSSDSTLKVWTRLTLEGDFLCTQTISFGTGFVLDASLIRVPNTDGLLLGCGTDDLSIHLYAEQNENFVKVYSLRGHEDWIRGVAFTIADNTDILLASCSQDCYIRIWRLMARDAEKIHDRQSCSHLPLDEEIKLKENTFTFSSRTGGRLCYAVVLETVLSGHDGWVYGLHWQPARIGQDGSRHQPMCLLSASMDKTMIVWKPDHNSGVWLDEVRVGTVGGNTLGLFGCQFAPDGRSIIAHGYQGALHLWHRQATTESPTQVESWQSGVTVGGHFEPVQDIAWDPDGGDYLLSVSSDQSTRLHGPWVREQTVTWYELARPQVHGYDLNCLTMINKTQFASGADEKVIRVFTAPRNFVTNYSRISDKDISTRLGKMSLDDLPEGASIPALGLSNKAVFDSRNQDGGDNQADFASSTKPAEGYFKAAILSEPPAEDDLLQNTLWPEVQKLYGHGYEIFALASSRDGQLLASACKASKQEHANIIIWETSSWKQIGCLTSHSLTVTQLAFSPCGAYLLSVSRDRTWALFKRNGSSLNRLAYTDKKTCVHARIIWSCAWSHDSTYFVTVSRDKKAVVWRVDDTRDNGKLGPVVPCEPALDLNKPITAVHMAPRLIRDRSYLMAFGLEDGTVELHTFTPGVSWTSVCSLDTSVAHHCTVKRVQFRPETGHQLSRDDGCGGDSETSMYLASCGADNAVKIYTVRVSPDLVDVPIGLMTSVKVT